MGMLAELAAAFPRVEETFTQASGVLGFDLWRLVGSGPEEELNLTVNTQPALLAAGVAVWRVWRENGGAEATVMAGHSLGEYTALVCAGSLDFEDAVALVAERGRQMQSAVAPGEGAMAAILGLDDEVVEDICVRAAQDGTVTGANYNAPGQVVIAGDAAAVERACALAGEAGARRAVTLAVSAPSHCTLMQPAADAMDVRLGETEILRPRVPVLHNVDVAEHGDPESIRHALVRQLCMPVRWAETVRALQRRGIARVLEMGPGRVLCGLIKRTERSLNCQSVNDPDSLALALNQ